MFNIFDYPQFQVFSSKDKDAPQLEHTQHSFSTVLKACLITGYGDKQPVSGWTMQDDIANGIRSFSSHALHSTRCEYRVSNDNAEQFTLSAYRENEDTPFAITHRSKRMFNVTGNQEWLVIANEISCYVLLQTDQDRPWFAVLFFGMAYTNHQAQYVSVLLGGEVGYSSQNYSINGMPLHDEWGNKTYWQAISHRTLSNTNNHHVFYPPFFYNHNAGYMVFLPALVESPYKINEPKEQYTLVQSTLHDALFFVTAWVENRVFGLAIQRESK